MALYHYSFEKEKPKVFIDFQNLCVGDAESYHGRMLDSKVTVEDNRTITGNSLVRGWVERNLFYVIQFDKPFILVENLRDTVVNKAPRKVLHFDLGKGNQLNAKIAFSTVSVEGAKANMEAELIRVAEVSVSGESDGYGRSEEELLYFHVSFVCSA